VDARSEDVNKDAKYKHGEPDKLTPINSDEYSDPRCAFMFVDGRRTRGYFMELSPS
jgi:hypothetical protein